MALDAEITILDLFLVGQSAAVGLGEIEDAQSGAGSQNIDEAYPRPTNFDNNAPGRDLVSSGPGWRGESDNTPQAGGGSVCLLLQCCCGEFLSQANIQERSFRSTLRTGEALSDQCPAAADHSVIRDRDGGGVRRLHCSSLVVERGI